MADNDPFESDWSSSPGETICDVLAERGVGVNDFASQLGRTLKETQDLLQGHSRIAPETAKRLSIVVGSTESFWLTREAQYRDALSRQQNLAAEDDYDAWLRELPTRDMVDFGWLPLGSREEMQTQCLRYFGVSNLRTWRDRYRQILTTTAFRTSPAFQSNLGSVAAWLRQGEIQAASLGCKKWDLGHFRNELIEIRRLTRERDPEVFIPLLKQRCAAVGLAVSIIRAPKNCRASGATLFLTPDKPLLLLSFRYLSDDHFWFTFFHECGHLLLHGSDSVFLETDTDVADRRETEANTFAANMLIPEDFQNQLSNLRRNAFDIVRFARTIGISPGIVVGQLQHAGRLPRNHFNNLKRFYEWK